jgi:hypothetical protein
VPGPCAHADGKRRHRLRRPPAAESQQFLDLILSQPRAFPDAAVLRAQIAIEDGNIPFAKRLVVQQIRLVPDHAGLHEAYAAALYLDGNMVEARSELTLAARSARPGGVWLYHLGLLEEAGGRTDNAIACMPSAHRKSWLGPRRIAHESVRAKGRHAAVIFRRPEGLRLLCLPPSLR